MAITVSWYGLGLQKIMQQTVNLETATVKLALVASGYAPNRDTDDYRNLFTANELGSGNGYTTGGYTLSGIAYSYDSASDQVRIDCNDPTWTFTASKTWRYGVMYVDTAGADTTDPLIALLDWGGDQTVSTGYTLTIDSAGLLYLDTT